MNLLNFLKFMHFVLSVEQPQFDIDYFLQLVFVLVLGLDLLDSKEKTQDKKYYKSPQIEKLSKQLVKSQ